MCCSFTQSTPWNNCDKMQRLGFNEEARKWSKNDQNQSNKLTCSYWDCHAVSVVGDEFAEKTIIGYSFKPSRSLLIFYQFPKLTLQSPANQSDTRRQKHNHKVSISNTVDTVLFWWRIIIIFLHTGSRSGRWIILSDQLSSSRHVNCGTIFEARIRTTLWGHGV